MGCRPRSWQVGSVCRGRCRYNGGSRSASSRGWSRCQRTPGGCCWWRRPSQSVIQRSAERAHARGGFAAAAAFLERATAFTVEPSRRAERALAAAQTKILAGALDAVPTLLAAAEAGPLTELQQAQAHLSRAQLAY